MGILRLGVLDSEPELGDELWNDVEERSAISS